MGNFVCYICVAKIKAKEIFRRICPDDEFFPKPPDQEDIIFDDSNEEPNNNIETETEWKIDNLFIK